MVTKAQQAENKLKEQRERYIKWKADRAAKRDRENNNDDDDSLAMSIVSASDRPKELQGHNAFDKSSHWDTPTTKRVRKKPTDVYVPATMGSPTSSIDSPMATAARATNVNVEDSDDEECKQTLIGTRVAVKLGVLPFFGTILSCRLGIRNAMLWFIQYDDGVDEEEVLIADLRQRQKLYLKHQSDDTVGNSKQPATGLPKRTTPPSTTKKANTKRPRPPPSKKKPPTSSKKNSTKKKTPTKKKKKTPTKKKKKKNNKEPLPPPKLKNAECG